jgi:hypothetical protein
MREQPNLHKLSPRDEELATMLETEFPSIWKTALEVANGHNPEVMAKLPIVLPNDRMEPFNPVRAYTARKRTRGTTPSSMK